MAFSHFVPAGKQLYLPTGGYTFTGPRQVDMKGVQKLPEFYTDGTPTAVAPIMSAHGPSPAIIGKPKVHKKRAVPKPEIAKPVEPSE